MLLTSIVIIVICLTIYYKRKVKHASLSNKDVVYDVVNASSHAPPPLPASRHYFSQAHYQASTQEQNLAYNDTRSNRVVNGSTALKEAAAGSEAYSSIALTGNVAYRNGGPSENQDDSTGVDSDGYEQVSSENQDDSTGVDSDGCEQVSSEYQDKSTGVDNNQISHYENRDDSTGADHDGCGQVSSGNSIGVDNEQVSSENQDNSTVDHNGGDGTGVDNEQASSEDQADGTGVDNEQVSYENQDNSHNGGDGTGVDSEQISYENHTGVDHDGYEEVSSDDQDDSPGADNDGYEQVL